MCRCDQASGPGGVPSRIGHKFCSVGSFRMLTQQVRFRAGGAFHGGVSLLALLPVLDSTPQTSIALRRTADFDCAAAG